MKGQREILRIDHLSKSFPGVKALDDISITIYENEVLGLCGENGAGKSTLFKVLTGIYSADKGKVYFRGNEISFRSPRESIRAGINIIHQELSYLSYLTVAENIYQGNLPVKHGLIDWKKLFDNTKLLLKKYEIDIDPTLVLNDLSMAQKQIIEIMKAISRKAKVVIMDEPTSSLGMDDVEKLVKIIHKLTANGISIVFISHRLEEVLNVSDRLIVLRDGKKVAEFDKEEFDERKIIEKMIGRGISQIFPKEIISIGRPMLVFENVSSSTINDINLEVKAGEIVGLYGMAGAGQDQVMKTAFGLGGKYTGSILLDGKVVNMKCPADAIKNGIGYITAERKVDGLVLCHSVGKNIVLSSLQKLSKKGVIDYRLENSIAEKWINKLSIKVSSVSTVMNNLSGGNQQKVVLSKWFELYPKVLLLNEPTRGVDVGAKQEIFVFVQNMCRQGISVLMISSDMMEIIGMADVIYTVYEGKITGKFPKKDVSEYKLMLGAIGKWKEGM